MVNYIAFANMSQMSLLFFIFIAITDIIIAGVIVLGLTSRVELSENGIQFKSLFKKTNLTWNQIKSFGVYFTGRNITKTIDKKEYEKFIWGGQKFIYLTDQKGFNPSKLISKPQSGYIDFHFRKEAIQYIEDKMK